MLRLYNTLCTQSYNPIIMLRLYCMTDASQNVHRAMESWHVQCEWMGLQGLLVIHRNRAMHKVIIIIIVFVITIINYRRSALFFSVSLAVLDPRVGHTIWTYFLHLSFLSFWLTLLRESCPRLDVVHPGRAWSSSPACTWHCFWHYISFSRQLPCFLMVWPQYASFLALIVSNSFLFTPVLLRTHSYVCCPWNLQNLSQFFHLYGLKSQLTTAPVLFFSVH